MGEHIQQTRIRKRHRRLLCSKFQVVNAGRHEGTANQIQPFLNFIFVLEVCLVADSLGGKENVQVELVELALHGDFSDRIRQLVGQQHHPWQRGIGIIGTSPIPLGSLFV